MCQVISLLRFWWNSWDTWGGWFWGWNLLKLMNSSGNSLKSWAIVEFVGFRWFLLSFGDFCWGFVEISLRCCWDSVEILLSFGCCIWGIIVVFVFKHDLPVEFLLSFCWVSVGFRGFLLSFCWVSVGFIWGVDFLLSFVGFCWVSVEFWVFRFKTDSTKSQQNFNRNHRNSTEKQSPKLNRFNTDSTE